MKSPKLLSLTNFVYFVGVVFVLICGAAYLFGSNASRAYALIWLALGAPIVLIICYVTYRNNDIGNSRHKWRNQLLLFIPGFVCAGVLLFIIGLFIAMAVTGQSFGF